MSPRGRQAVVFVLGQAEVGDPDHAGVVEQQVRRLDIAVDDAAGVGVGQPLRRLAADLRHAAEERRPAAGEGGRRDLRPAGQHGRGRRGMGRARTKPSGSAAAGPRAELGSGPSRSVGRPAGAGRVARSGTAASFASRPVRSNPATRPSVGSPGPVAAAAVLPGAHRRAVATASRGSRASSSMIWSSPWPWMNCMA